MAQLIKLQDYVSKYQADIYHFPSKFIQLKKDSWSKMKQLYESGELSSKAKGRHPAQPLPETDEELKRYFLNGLLPIQLKWASSTVWDLSYIHRSFHKDDILRFFLHRIPDSYLLMYNPIVLMRQSEMEALPILIGPQGVEIIHYVSGKNGGTLEPTKENSWMMNHNGFDTKIINPTYGLKRTEAFVQSVCKNYGLHLPIKKIVMAPDLRFRSTLEPFGTDLIGKDRFKHWLTVKRTGTSPLKSEQLKTADALLKHCKTVSFRRPEWQEH